MSRSTRLTLGASDAAYQAIECADNAYFPGPGSVNERLVAWLALGKNALRGSRLPWGYYSHLPCLFWPGAPSDDPRPAPPTDTDYPVFILSSTTDSATPIANAHRIHERIGNSFLFEAFGGRHGSFAWGLECPDQAIAAYLVNGVLPQRPVTICPGSVIGEYVPTAMMSVSEYTDAIEIMESIESQILYSDAYQYRLVGESLKVGCDFGGTVTYTATHHGLSMSLDKCRLVRDWPMTGAGKMDRAGSFGLNVTSGSDRLDFSQDADGNSSVCGTLGWRMLSGHDPLRPCTTSD